MPFLRGQTQVLQAKSNWRSLFPQNMKSGCALLPLTHWSWLTEPTEIGMIVGFFLYLKVSTTPFCSGFAFTLWRMGPRAGLVHRNSLLSIGEAACPGKWLVTNIRHFDPLLPDVPRGSVPQSECFHALRKKKRLSPMLLTLFSGAEG